jgi:hypothetical protein
MKNFIIGIVSVLLFVILGCASIQDAVIPCNVEPGIINYVQTTDPCFSPTSIIPYTSLNDSRRTTAYFNFFHIKNQTAWERLKIDDNMYYDFATSRQSLNEENAIALGNQIFSPGGLLGLLAPALMGGTLGALLIKRPQDLTPQQVKETFYTEDEVKALTNGKTQA